MQLRYLLDFIGLQPSYYRFKDQTSALLLALGIRVMMVRKKLKGELGAIRDLFIVYTGERGLRIRGHRT